MARFVAMVLILAALSACGQKESAQSPAAPAEPIASGEVVTADQLGPFASDVSDVAFWTNTKVPFQGLVLVATADGVTAFNIEDGETVSEVEAAKATGVEVVYSGSGATARGIAIIAANGGLRFEEIANDTRAFKSLASKGAPTNVGTFCAGPDRDGTLKLFAIYGKSIAAFSLAINDDVTVTASANAKAPADIAGCVVDPVDGSVFLAGVDAAIYRLASNGEIDPAPFAKSAASKPTAIGLALNGLVEGGATEECCGQIALLDASDARVLLFDRDDGKAIGAVRLSSSFDVEGVAVATAMGVGYGNFGGVYRDGVLALATDGDTPHVRLAPLNGALDSLSTPMGETADPRALSPQEPVDDGLIINVDLVNE